MQHFIGTLISECRNAALPEEYDFFGELVGSWEIDYVDNDTGRTIRGEWHFARILDGMAIQDVILLPGFEHGTTLRVYNPATRTWDIAYCYTGRIMRFEARRVGDRIVLSSLEDERRKWVFVRIEASRFHWQDVRVREDGEWHADFDLYARRIG